MHPWGGAVIDRSPPLGRETWFWSARVGSPLVEGWGNLVQGFRFDPSTWDVRGIWASSGQFNANNSGKCAYHEMRAFVTHTAVLSQQAIRAVELQSGDLALVLGCPGGRIRVIQPGGMRIDNNAYHDIGTLDSTSYDLGLGCSALAVRAEANGWLTIWCGTTYGPCVQPFEYTNPQGLLHDDEVATGAVHRLTWIPGSGFSNVPVTKQLYKSTALPRGGYGVVGLTVADLLPAPGDEVIVGTLAGDIIVLNEGLTTVLWRGHVPGAAGFYNSIHVENLDGDPFPELYVSGSFGIWRFTLPGE